VKANRQIAARVNTLPYAVRERISHENPIANHAGYGSCRGKGELLHRVVAR
jgi:hypothetical protein